MLPLGQLYNHGHTYPICYELKNQPVELMEYSVPCLDKAFPSFAPRTLRERN